MSLMREEVENQIRDLKAENRLLKNINRHLMNNSMDAIILIDPAGRISFANRSACDFFGMTEQELIQSESRSIMIPGDKGMQTALSSIAVKGKFAGELNFRKKDGSCLQAQAIASEFNDQAGGKMLSFIIRKNIAGEKAGSDNECSYRMLFENMSSGVVIYEMKAGEIIIKDINPAGEKRAGIARKDAIGKSPFSLWPMAPDFGLENFIHRVLRSGETISFPIKCLDERGEMIWIENELSRSSDTEVVDIFRDVSRRESARQALEESETKFRTVIEAVDDGIALFSAEGVALTWNRGAENITGINARDIVGKSTGQHLFKVIHEDGSPYRSGELPSDRTLATGQPVKNETLGIVQDSGEIRWAVANTAPIFRRKSPDPYLVCLSFSDITDFHENKERLEQEVHRRTNELDETNSALKVLMRKREQDLRLIEKKLISNCNALIVPLLTRLKLGMADPQQKRFVDVINKNLMAVLSPFSEKLAAPRHRLTPSEIQIAAMITQGLSNKEMAQVLNISLRTITNHRDNIRTKLNLKNTKINLRSYLMRLK